LTLKLNSRMSELRSMIPQISRYRRIVLGMLFYAARD
jgi:hypothetical protein